MIKKLNNLFNKHQSYRFQLRHHNVIAFYLLNSWAIFEICICSFVLLCHKNEYARNFLNELCSESEPDCGHFITKALYSRLVIAIFLLFGNFTVSISMDLHILNINCLAYMY